MRDHHFIEDDGTRTAIADLSLRTLMELLNDGVDVVGDVSEEQFMERLRIELTARSITV
jgi:hypothetical protein